MEEFLNFFSRKIVFFGNFWENLSHIKIVGLGMCKNSYSAVRSIFKNFYQRDRLVYISY